MTRTYNRFHNRTETAEDIQRLRALHATMDRVVLEDLEQLSDQLAPLLGRKVATMDVCRDEVRNRDLFQPPKCL